MLQMLSLNADKTLCFVVKLLTASDAQSQYAKSWDHGTHQVLYHVSGCHHLPSMRCCVTVSCSSVDKRPEIVSSACSAVRNYASGHTTIETNAHSRATEMNKL